MPLSPSRSEYRERSIVEQPEPGGPRRRPGCRDRRGEPVSRRSDHAALVRVALDVGSADRRRRSRRTAGHAGQGTRGGPGALPRPRRRLPPPALPRPPQLPDHHPGGRRRGTRDIGQYSRRDLGPGHLGVPDRAEAHRLGHRPHRVPRHPPPGRRLHHRRYRLQPAGPVHRPRGPSRPTGPRAPGCGAGRGPRRPTVPAAHRHGRTRPPQRGQGGPPAGTLAGCGHRPARRRRPDGPRDPRPHPVRAGRRRGRGRGRRRAGRHHGPRRDRPAAGGRWHLPPPRRLATRRRRVRWRAPGLPHAPGPARRDRARRLGDRGLPQDVLPAGGRLGAAAARRFGLPPLHRERRLPQPRRR